MKKKVLTGLFMIMALSLGVLAQNSKTGEFKVNGNCSMCKTRIEKAATSVEGVSFADWSEESKLLKLTYDPGKAGLRKIHKAIALAGHDTELYRAPQEAYDKLPACCKYDRKVMDKPAGHPGPPEVPGIPA